MVRGFVSNTYTFVQPPETETKAEESEMPSEMPSEIPDIQNLQEDAQEEVLAPTKPAKTARKKKVAI
jgi:hypothetical protein